MFRSSFFVLLLATPAFAQPAIDFNRDVRQILSGKCFQCHGPDDKVRQAGLRFDLRDGATKTLKSGSRAIVPGDPTNSEMAVRISVTDGDGVMPPVKTGKKLSAGEIATLKRWVEQGAKYAVHWSYVKPGRPALPVGAPPSVHSPNNAAAAVRSEGKCRKYASGRFRLLRSPWSRPSWTRAGRRSPTAS